MSELPIAAPRNQIENGQFWDWVNDPTITSYPMARPYIGDFFEEATAQLTGAARLKTQAYALCPDLQYTEDVYLETKAVGKHRASLLYEHRIEKYDQFVHGRGKQLYYVFWFHHFDATKEVPLSELRQLLAASVERVAVVPLWKVHMAAREGPARETSYSGTREGPAQYNMKLARTIRPAHLRAWSNGQSEIGVANNVYGANLGIVPVYGRLPEPSERDTQH